MALPAFTMRELLEAGVHFGHQTHRWNPKMGPYIYGVRNKIHIIDLSQTMPHLHRAMQFVRDIVAGGGRVLFVGTKRQASQPIAEAAKRCGQFYVNHRWLGGMLTNWQTISKSITRLKELDGQLESEEASGLTKKELLQLQRQRNKLERALGGIREMGGLPDVIFVIDTNREEIAVHEANNLKIPVVAVLDSNSDPDGIAFPIPGNDDATRAIKFFCDLVCATVLDGIQEELTEQGVDTGAAEKTPAEPAVEAPKAEAEAPEAKAPEAEAPEGEAKAEKADKAEKAEKKPAKADKAPKEEAKEEAKDEPKKTDKTAEAAKAEDKAAKPAKADKAPKEEAKEEAREEPKEAAKEAAKEEPKKADKAPKEEAKEEAKEAAKEADKEEPKKVPEAEEKAAEAAKADKADEKPAEAEAGEAKETKKITAKTAAPKEPADSKAAKTDDEKK